MSSLNNSSVVQWIEETERNRCGYCKSCSSISNGMWAERLTVDDYQDLIDRGWRRSGKYCYKPIMDKTCCPLYTIKCDAVNFSLSKSQKKAIKKFNKFLKDGELSSKDDVPENHILDESEGCSLLPKEIPNIDLCNVISNISDHVEASVTTLHEASPSNICEQSKECSDDKEQCQKNLGNTEEICDKMNESSQTSQKNTLKEGKGADPNKPPCKKAKLVRLERKKEKSKKKGLSFEKLPTVQAPKTLQELLEEVMPEDQKIKLKMCLIPTSVPNSNWGSVEKAEFELYKKYQMTVHDDPPEKLTMNGFNRFLVKSPLKPESFPDGIEGVGYGSFHQQYWLDDKLIAVGVIDILPKCVSSVYFFYDPDYRSLTLGTYGSMREIQLTQQLQTSLPDLRSYYMGFYIHSTPKMRYKGKLVPSFLKCPETYSWIPIEKCIPLLEVNKYSRLTDDIDAIDRDLPNEDDISEIKIVYKYSLMRFSDYKLFVDDELEKYKEIGKLVGTKCLSKLIFWEH